MDRRTSQREVDPRGARVTPQQAADGLLEFVLPDGQRILVDLRGRAAGDPDIEAEVIQMLLDAEASDADIYGAVEEYAGASGMEATFFLGSDALIVALGTEAPTASHGS